MVAVDFALTLLAVAALAYFLADLVPRVDEMTRSYRKFLALSALGTAEVVLLGLLLTILAASTDAGSIEIILALAVTTFVLFTVTLLGDIADDWLRLFADPEYNTWVEVSMVVALVVLLFVAFWATSP
ncbi:MAG: hypothetical protein ACLFMX_03790 [Halobacteriales archaeon]